MAKQKSYCVIGLGNFGATVARSLAEHRKEVLAIDCDHEKIDRIAKYVTAAVCGDATDEAVLRAAGVEDYDCCIVCFENGIEDSAMTTLALKEMGVSEIIARAASERHDRLLRKIGADRVIFPERDAGRKLAQTVSMQDVLDYFHLSEDLVICELNTPKAWHGKSLLELNVRKNYNVNVIACSQAGSDRLVLMSDPAFRFAPNTYVVIAGDSKSVRRLAAG